MVADHPPRATPCPDTLLLFHLLLSEVGTHSCFHFTEQGAKAAQLGSGVD